MNLLIAFDSKTGTSKRVAELIAKEFENQNIKFLDLRKNENADLKSFDIIILGGSVRYGKLSKFLLGFIEKNKEIILQKKFAFYLCCASAPTAEDYIKELVPKEIKEKAIVVEYLGGELNPNNCKGFDKLVIKLARKYMTTNDDIDNPSEFKTLPSILPDRISYFAEIIKKSLRE